VFSPDGNMLAASNSDITGVSCAATVWEVATKRELATFPASPNGPLAFSPDSKLLAAAGWGGTGGLDGPGAPVVSGVKLWDVTAKQEAATLRSQGRPLFSVAFSPDGKQMVTTNGTAIQLWEVAARRKVAVLPIYNGL
jgi:WD40 repeat protein